MLESGTPAQWAEWQEYHMIEPFGDDWHRSSLMAARTINTVVALAGTDEKSEKQFYEDDDFVPKRKGTVKQDAETKAKCDAADAIEGLGV